MKPLDRLREWLRHGTYEDAIQSLHVATMENNLKASEELLKKAIAEREAAEIGVRIAHILERNADAEIGINWGKQGGES